MGDGDRPGHLERCLGDEQSTASAKKKKGPRNLGTSAPFAKSQKRARECWCADSPRRPFGRRNSGAAEEKVLEPATRAALGASAHSACTALSALSRSAEPPKQDVKGVLQGAPHSAVVCLGAMSGASGAGSLGGRCLGTYTPLPNDASHAVVGSKIGPLWGSGQSGRTVAPRANPHDGGSPFWIRQGNLIRGKASAAVAVPRLRPATK